MVAKVVGVSMVSDSTVARCLCKDGSGRCCMLYRSKSGPAKDTHVSFMISVWVASSAHLYGFL